MKNAVAMTLMVLSSSAFAQQSVVKECSVTMQIMDTGKSADMNMKIISKDGKLSAEITTSSEGTVSSTTDTVEVSEGTVRENLLSQIEALDLNDAEKVVGHAMITAQDPVLSTIFSSGIDLQKVRSAKVYTIGVHTSMGSAAIVEAKDANNKILGSFLGGFLVSPCK